MHYSHDELLSLLPQRAPILMVDSVNAETTDDCLSTLTLAPDNFFIEPSDGLLAEPGLIEHIAQSASALAGHRAKMIGQPAPVGYIGEIKKFHCYRRPAVGEQLCTTVSMGTEVNGVTLLTGVTQVDGVTVADTQMKIFTADK